MNALLAVLRRELGAYFLSPISYVIAALFLCVHGYGFFLLCQVLTTQRASTAAVMQYFFGGTFLYWVFLMFVVAVLTMRLLAEERQRGTLEPLLTAPVREETIVLGKYLAALIFYLFLWAPTAAYAGLLRAHAGDGVHLDLGPIAAAYLGTALCGMSALAVGLLASALSRSQILAAALSFSALTLLLLAGLLGDLFLRSEALREVLLYCNWFRHMDEMARGIIDSRRVVYHLSLAGLGLFCAARVLHVRAGEVRRGLVVGLEAGLCLLLCVAVNVAAARRPHRADWTASRLYTLSPLLTDLLKELGGKKVQVTAVGLEAQSAEDPGGVLDATRELLQRAVRAAGGGLALELLDVDRDRERVRVLGERYHLDRDDLRQGVVVLESGGRQKFIGRADLAEFEGATPAGEPPRLTSYRGEAALAAALLTVLEERTSALCFSTGHGEPAFDSLTGDGLADLAEALRRENMQSRGLPGAIAPEALEGCDVLVIANPERPLLQTEVRALEGYLDGGGRLLGLLGPLLDSGVSRFGESGLEELLRARGVVLGQAVVIDPERRLGESLAFTVDQGYGAHPVTERLQGKRTLWTLARPVRVLPASPLASGALWSATELVQTGERGFGETDLAALREGRPVAGQGDVEGPVPLAAASQVKGARDREGRLVILGSGRFACNDTMALFNKDLVLSAARWLLSVQREVRIAPKTPEQLRLVLEQDQLTRLFLVVVIGMPLMALLLGAGVFWIRRG